MTSITDSPEFVPVRIRAIMNHVKGLLEKQDAENIRNQWRERWALSLHKIVEERNCRPEVEIALMGGTGAGKSTLVNGLLDARILPVSNMRACTAAISEIAYSESQDYRARVEFISRESWHKEIKLLLEDICDSQVQSNGGEDGDAVAIPRVANEKLSAVYGPWESGKPPSPKIAEYPEPPEIQQALDQGFEEISTPSLDEFRKRIRDYLDSKCRFWPIVKTVRISGPFSALKCGAKIVDLPGINDPNESREEVTKSYLKRSQFVWIVFNIKRVLTKDVSNLMQSDDFVRQIVMDGRENALTFVGTASDDIDIDSAREEFGIDEEASLSEIALARNKAVRNEVNAQVADIAERIARNADSPERATSLRAALLNSRVFTVSARDYLALTGLAKNRPSFTGADETEIGQLRDHMIKTCSAFGVEAQARAHHARINQIIHEIKAEVSRSTSAIDQKRSMSQAGRKELQQAITRLSGFLERDLQDHRERFSQELTSGQEVLAERIKRSTERGQHELHNVVTHWKRVHWATLRAVARRGGRYLSPTSGQHDFAEDVAKPILDGITFAWTDFFGDRLTALLEKWSDKLLSLGHRYGMEVLKEVAALKVDPRSRTEADFASVIQTTEHVIRELVGQIKADMSRHVNEVRRTLYQRIPEQVAANMTPVFLAAAEEKGTGMKDRMVSRIATEAERVSRDMFGDMAEQINEGVRSLHLMLVKRYGEMGETITRHSGLPVANLLEAEELSTEELESRKAAFREIAEALKELPIVAAKR